MPQPASIANSTGQKLDVIVGDDGIVRLKKAIGAITPSGLSNESAWQGAATHEGGGTYAAGDGVALGAGVDGTDVLPVLVDSTGRLIVVPQASGGALTDRSGSITAGGTAQSLAASAGTRKYLFIHNISDTDMWINFGTTAVADQPSIKLVPGASFSMEGSFVSTESISIICATTAKKFTAKEAI